MILKFPFSILIEEFKNVLSWISLSISFAVICLKVCVCGGCYLDLLWWLFWATYAKTESLCCTPETNTMSHVDYISVTKYILCIGYELGIVLVSGYNMETKTGSWLLGNLQSKCRGVFQWRVNYQMSSFLSVGGRFLVSSLIGEVICTICLRPLTWLGRWCRWSPFINFLKWYTVVVIGTWDTIFEIDLGCSLYKAWMVLLLKSLRTRMLTCFKENAWKTFLFRDFAESRQRACNIPSGDMFYLLSVRFVVNAL